MKSRLKKKASSFATGSFRFKDKEKEKKESVAQIEWNLGGASSAPSSTTSSSDRGKEFSVKTKVNRRLSVKGLKRKTKTADGTG
jgi:hypothetical protein